MDRQGILIKKHNTDEVSLSIIPSHLKVSVLLENTYNRVTFSIAFDDGTFHEL